MTHSDQFINSFLDASGGRLYPGVDVLFFGRIFNVEDADRKDATKKEG